MVRGYKQIEKGVLSTMITVSSFSAAKARRATTVYSIALSHPKNVGVRGMVQCLMPTWGMVKGFKRGSISEAEYTARYGKLIVARWSEVKRWLDSLNGNEYLCCWCITGFCHRYLVAKLIRKYRSDLEVKLS